MATVSRMRTALEIIATLAMIAASVTIVVNYTRSEPTARSNQPAIPKEPITIGSQPSLGVPAAKVAIIEFSDFQCPFCARYANDILPKLIETYVNTGKVRYTFNHMPLEKIHRSALKAAEAAECAADRGQFWPFHDQLFR